MKMTRAHRATGWLAVAGMLGAALITPGATLAGSVSYATVAGHAPFSAESNKPTYWGEDCVDGGVSSGASWAVPQSYQKVIVKAGSSAYANTIFDNVAAGQTVWADTNGNNQFDPGGQDGDKNISHIILCGPAVTTTTSTTETTDTTATTETTDTTATTETTDTTETTATTDTTETTRPRTRPRPRRPRTRPRPRRPRTRPRPRDHGHDRDHETTDTTSTVETETTDTTATTETTDTTSTVETETTETSSTGTASAETGNKSDPTPPPTDASSIPPTSGTTGGGWQLLLLAASGILAAALLLAPSAARKR